MIQRLKFAAFAVFVLVDIALIALLLQHVNQNKAAQDQTSNVTPAATPSTASTDQQPNGAWSLTMASDGALFRSARGSCNDNGRPYLEVSTDRGAHFSELALPLLKAADDTDPNSRSQTVKTVLRIEATSAKKLTVVGNDANCDAHVYSTKDGGESWKAAEPDAHWYVNASVAEVVSPAQASEPGCDVISLSEFSDRNVKVACTDGSIRGTDDSGTTWVTLGELPGLQTATFTDLRQGFAIAATADCKARAFVTANAGLNWTAAGCLGKAPAASIVGTGPTSLVALLTTDNGSVVKTSVDGGAKWKKAA